MTVEELIARLERARDECPGAEVVVGLDYHDPDQERPVDDASVQADEHGTARVVVWAP